MSTRESTKTEPADNATASAVEGQLAATPEGVCAICAYSKANGWWGPDCPGAHCRECHRSWTSLVEAHCVTCHAHFSTDSTAHRHRKPGGGCEGPASMRTKVDKPVYKQVERKSGPVWVTYDERELAWTR